MGKHVTKKKNTFRKTLRNSVDLITEYDEKKEITVTDYIKIAAAVVILVIINFFKVNGIVELLAYLIPFFLVSYDIFFSAIRKINRSSFPDDEAIVIGCSILCFAIGSYTEAVTIVIAYKIILILYDIINKSTTKLDSKLTVGSSEVCLIKTPEGGIKIGVPKTLCDDILLIGNDETVPLDGLIESGRGAFDYSQLTGEDTELILRPGDTAAEDSINRTGAAVTVKVVAESDESTGHVLRSRIRSAASESSGIEKLIYKGMKIFGMVCIPAAVIVAVIPGIITDMWFDWISRAVIILFVSQVKIFRNLILYIFDSGMIRSALGGIFIRNNKAIERLKNTETFVFEKAGVITEGDFEIRKVVPVGISEAELLGYAAKAESSSEHPLAVTLRRAVDDRILNKYTLDHFTEYPGKGVSAYINGNKVYAGKYSFVSGFCEPHTYSDSAGTNIHLCINGKYSGYISFADRIKDGAFDALEKLRADRSGKLVMLTGDSAISSRKLASALNFDMIKSEVTPEDKKNSLEYLIKNKNKGTCVAYIGKSRTDESILESADVALTYESLYDYPLINESSDVLIFGKGIDKVSETVSVSNAVLTRARISLIVYASVKALIIIFGLTGLLHVLPAVLIDTVLTILMTVYTLLKKI